MEEPQPQILSGSQLVAKGVTKADAKLPGLGSKEVSSSGSWLEQKQVQSALEARKQLIGVERIEKSGSLSFALWRDDLQVAEVTQKSGGHWQYIGHNVGKALYLQPEETLFLMEVNCLQLKHNGVTVSLQKAYSLCLRDISIQQYKVYASLSRLGYRVFRHEELKEPPHDKSDETAENKEVTDGSPFEECPVSNNENGSEICDTIASNEFKITCNEIPPNPTLDPESTFEYNSVKENNISKNVIIAVEDTNMAINEIDSTNSVHDGCKNADNEIDQIYDEDICKESEVTNLIDCDSNTQNNIICMVKRTEQTDTENSTTPVLCYSVDEHGIIRIFGEDEATKADSSECDARSSCTAEPKTEEHDSGASDPNKHYETEINYYNAKMQKLVKRKSALRRDLEKLCSIQDFYQEQVVSVNVPDEKYLPRSIFLDKAAYVLNIDVVRNQNASNVNVSSDEMEINLSPSPQESRSTDAPNQVLPSNVRNNNFNSASYRSYRGYYRPTSHWRPQAYSSYYSYNMYRPTQAYMVHPRYRFQPYPYVRQHYMGNNQTVPSASNIQRDNRQNATKMYHYDTIVNITTRFKRGLCTPSQVQALRSLLSTYNSHYHERLELTMDFDIIDRKDQNRIKEVIVLDDEPKRKKARLSNDSDSMKQNLEKLKALAAKLKDLQMKDLAVSRHRRFFSNAIKTYNKCFKADVYLDSDFEIRDRKLVIIDSSSDSDAVITVEDTPKMNGKEKSKKRKKLRNPYSILKSCLINDNEASTSGQVPTLQTLSLNVNNIAMTNRNGVCENGTASPVLDTTGEGLLKYFSKAWLPSDDDFGRAEVCSQLEARLDAIFFEQEYINELKESTEHQSWLDLKISMLKDLQRTLEIQKQQAVALSNDFLMETESQIQPIVSSDCTDLRSALKKLAIISTNNDVPATRLRIDFDVYNRDVNIKKTNLPKPNFRVICLDESSPFPASGDVVGLQAKYMDGVPTIFAFIGDSVSYLHINQIDLPMYIPDDLS